MDASTPGGVGGEGRPGNYRKGKGEQGRPHVHSLGGSLNTLWEWSSASLGRGHHLAGFFQRWSLGCSNSQERGPGMENSTQTF